MLLKAKKLYQAAIRQAGFRRYFKNTSWLFGGQMFRLLLGLFVSVAVARYLGPKDFGLYNYVMSIVTIVGVVAHLGLKELAKRELIESPVRCNEILGTCFTVSLIAGIILYVGMLIVVALQTNQSLMFNLFALLGSSLILSSLSYIELWFQAQVRSELSVIATSISLSLFAALKIVAIIQGLSLIAFGYLFVFEAIILCLLQIYFFSKHYGSILLWQVRWKTALLFLKQSWPLILSGLAVIIFMKIDMVMLGILLNEEAVGQYSVAVRVSSVWYFIPVILASSLFPAILKARKQSSELYEKRLQNYFDLNAGLAYLIAIPLSIAAPWVILVLFGKEYQPAGSILAIHAWSSLFVFLGVARTRYLFAEKMFKFSMSCTIMGAIVNIALNYLLIPSYEGIGAAVATIWSQAISSFLSSFIWHKTREVGCRQFKAYAVFLRIPYLIKSIRV